MSFDKHTYQPDPSENSVADQIEREEYARSASKSAIITHLENWAIGLSVAIWLFAALCERCYQ